MWKKLAAMLVILSLTLPAGAAARQDMLRVWHALAPEDTDALQSAALAFGRQTGVEVALEFVQPTLIYESVVKIDGPGPDVIVAGNDAMAPLVEAKRVQPLEPRGPFFLDGLLADLPRLLEERCRDEPLQPCLWGDLAPSLSVDVPDGRMIELTAAWLCEASPYLPFCKGGGLAGLPVSWGFTLFLLNTQWMAENGLELPVTAEGVREIRSKFGLDFIVAEPDFLPLAEDVRPDAIVVISSALLAQEPDRLMQSLASFKEWGYVPVPAIQTDAAYVVSGADNPDLAEKFVGFISSEFEAKVRLLGSSGRLPALAPDELRAWGLESDEALVILRAMTILTALASTVY